MRSQPPEARSSDEAFALLDVIFERAPVGLAFFDPEGRYVRINERLADINGLSPADHIGRTAADAGSEIQLTDALRMMVKEHPMYGLKLKGRRCDIGNKDGFVKTNIEFALHREEMAEELREYIRQLARQFERKSP